MAVVDDPTARNVLAASVKGLRVKPRGPRKPTLDEMGPGVEAIPARDDAGGGRSKLGRPGMRGGWKSRKQKH